MATKSKGPWAKSTILVLDRGMGQPEEVPRPRTPSARPRRRVQTQAFLLGDAATILSLVLWDLAAAHLDMQRSANSRLKRPSREQRAEFHAFNLNAISAVAKSLATISVYELDLLNVEGVPLAAIAESARNAGLTTWNSKGSISHALKHLNSAPHTELRQIQGRNGRYATHEYVRIQQRRAINRQMGYDDYIWEPLRIWTVDDDNGSPISPYEPSSESRVAGDIDSLSLLAFHTLLKFSRSHLTLSSKSENANRATYLEWLMEDCIEHASVIRELSDLVHSLIRTECSVALANKTSSAAIVRALKPLSRTPLYRSSQALAYARDSTRTDTSEVTKSLLTYSFEQSVHDLYQKRQRFILTTPEYAWSRSTIAHLLRWT
ncbi:hypothetical protein [Lapillicoccus jejuensis]|uniref:Uncharacterized protein n=1 Tax=Lapillicoccus jejuensis TaxID=402171 RepID=A0A542E0U1_9MICO|nr:hypothetical protein [Lapillicoccus jejuensis]TQJ08814.1 hypothetical protein FB458_1910 [Lapillicoccus jejuensis]